MKYRFALLIVLACICSVLAEAKVKLPSVLSDGMVLQRERPIKIWGTADPGENVVVTFKKKKYTAVADENGKWLVTLPAMKAGGPYELTVNEMTVKDILIGDVWLCSGQSNMELTVARVADMFGRETATYENSMVRYVKTPYGNDLHGPKEDISQMNWTALNPQVAQSYAALPYFFAIEMYNETKVPVGIINSSWGGSSIEAWMSEDALQAFPKNLRERDIYNSDEYKALVFSILATIFATFAGGLGCVLGIVGLVLSIIGVCKKYTKKVAPIVGIVFSCIAIFLGIIMSGSGTTVSEDITPKSDREYVDNINTVVSDPDSYAGKYIKFYGIVSQTCDEGDDYYIYQAYTDTDYNNSILLKVSKDVSAKEFKEDSFISVDAKITGSYSGQTVMGVDTSWAYMIAADAKETTYIDSFGKADTTWEFEDQSIEQHGITVKVTKVEFAENETRFYVDVTNNSNDNVSIYSSSAKVVQNKKQYEESYSAYSDDYPQLSDDLTPGASSSGIITFDKIKPANLQLILEGYSDNYDIDLSDFKFDLEQ